MLTGLAALLAAKDIGSGQAGGVQIAQRIAGTVVIGLEVVFAALLSANSLAYHAVVIRAAIMNVRIRENRYR